MALSHGAAAGAARLGSAQPLAAGTEAVPPNGLLRLPALRLAFRVLDADEDPVTAASDAGEAAAVLRRLLDAVDGGDLLADGPLALRVVQQLRGAVVALDAVASQAAVDAANSASARRT